MYKLTPSRLGPEIVYLFTSMFTSYVLKQFISLIEIDTFTRPEIEAAIVGEPGLFFFKP